MKKALENALALRQKNKLTTHMAGGALPPAKIGTSKEFTRLLIFN